MASNASDLKLAVNVAESTQGALFTIGHSSHALEHFLSLLSRWAIGRVVDVRSHPVSRFAHFDKRPLADALRIAGVTYEFLGRELGARREEPECYESGRVNFDRVAVQPLFVRGLARVAAAARVERVALLCAEKDPLDCHRAILVCRHLGGRGLAIRHILADGEAETHEQAERRLVARMGIEPSLFDGPDGERGRIERAYAARAGQIAYIAEPTPRR